MSSSQTKTKITTIENNHQVSRWDYLATEEPLEINLIDSEGEKKTIAVTMRTPGADFDLAVGFLYSEGVIKTKQDIAKISYCLTPEHSRVGSSTHQNQKINSSTHQNQNKNSSTHQNQNIINVTLQQDITANLPSLERHFFTNSACGVCGKVSIENLKVRGYTALAFNPIINTEVIYSLPEKLSLAQGIFNSTGGLHAAGLFNEQGRLIKIREDVGRHNALDKLIGSALLAEEMPLENAIIMVSGRSSFEILQKCIAARVAIICAVSAPSSLAVTMAQEFGITLIGFLRDKRFNVYSGIERVKL